MSGFWAVRGLGVSSAGAQRVLISDKKSTFRGGFDSFGYPTFKITAARAVMSYKMFKNITGTTLKPGEGPVFIETRSEA